ncbi:MAG: heavy-metal-associated domain-containing protein [Candidatus Woesearchaeota archaeon]
MTKINLKINGMHCKSCEMLITDALEEAGAKAQVDSKKGTATIEFDEKKLTESKIKQIIQKEGFKVN